MMFLFISPSNSTVCTSLLHYCIIWHIPNPTFQRGPHITNITQPKMVRKHNGGLCYSGLGAWFLYNTTSHFHSLCLMSFMPWKLLRYLSCLMSLKKRWLRECQGELWVVRVQNCTRFRGVGKSQAEEGLKWE